MEDNVSIIQKAALGSATTQIGVQNNYIGLSPEEAVKMAIELFISNFPMLQNIAAEVAKKRAEEMVESVIKQLHADGVNDFSPFADPDVQYILYEAQKNHARLGTDEMLSTLSILVSKRISNDKDFKLKIILDKAISIVSFLSPEQLDYLSLTFICKGVGFTYIHTIEDLNEHLQFLCNAFPKVKIEDVPFLNTMGCLQLNLMTPFKVYAERYNFDLEETKKVCPDLLQQIHGDYGTSCVGTVLAIINAEAKTKLRFNMKLWM